MSETIIGLLFISIGLLFISIVIYALRVSWITKPYDKSGVDNYFANKRKDIP